MIEQMASAWQTIAPRAVWTIPAAIPRQRVFAAILSADGLDDYEVPVSVITLRLRDVKGSYVGVTVPDPVSHTAAILARASGRLNICSGYLTADGVRHLEPIIYGNINSIYFGQGQTNVLTLAGVRYATYANPRAVALSGVSSVSKDQSGRVRARCVFDLFVRPGDVVSVFGETFAIDLMICVITAADAYMDVEGVAI